MDASITKQIIILTLNFATVFLLGATGLLYIADWQRMQAKVRMLNFGLALQKATSIMIYCGVLILWCLVNSAVLFVNQHLSPGTVGCLALGACLFYTQLLYFCGRTGSWIDKYCFTFHMSQHPISRKWTFLGQILFPACWLIISILASSGKGCLVLHSYSFKLSISVFMGCSCLANLILFGLVTCAKLKNSDTLFETWKSQFLSYWNSLLLQTFLIVNFPLWCIWLLTLVDAGKHMMIHQPDYPLSVIVLAMALHILLYETLWSDKDMRRPFRFQRRKDAAMFSKEQFLQAKSSSSISSLKVNRVDVSTL